MLDFQDDLDLLRGEFSPFDVADLAACIGALQLVPENAGRTFSLRTLAAVIASLDDDSGLPEISKSNWRKLVKRSFKFAALDDPFDYPFVDEVTFYGGSYRVLPPISDDAVHIVRTLGKALFTIRERGSAETVSEEAIKISIAVLSLSEAIAEKAGLSRSVDASPIPNTFATPPADAYKELKDAVTFSRESLDDLMSESGVVSTVLAPLMAEPGSTRPSSGGRRIDGLDFVDAKPILKFGDKIVVIHPRGLLNALRHTLVSLFCENGVGEVLAEGFRRSVAGSTDRSLDLMGWNGIGSADLMLGDLPAIEIFSSFDLDKVGHFLVVTDDLREYDPTDLFGAWQINDLNVRIEAELAAAERRVFSASDPPNEVFHVVVFQGIGRPYSIVLGKTDLSVSSNLILLSAGDLETVSLLEMNDPIALYYYAHAHGVIRGEMEVVATGFLDEFSFYRSNRYSYYLSDERKPDGMFIAPGSAGDVRREVRATRDIHGAQYAVHGTYAEVVLLHHDRSFPVYTALNESLRAYVPLLVESGPIPIWITARDKIVDPRYGRLQLLISEMLAFWLWQSADLLNGIVDTDSSDQAQLVIELVLEQSDDWFQQSAQGKLDSTYRIQVLDSSRIRIMCDAGVMGLFAGDNNEGEQRILRSLLTEIKTAVGGRYGRGRLDDGGESSIKTFVDEIAPLGMKKMIHILDPRIDPRLDDSGLTPRRLLQRPKADEVLDELGTYARTAMGLSEGPIGSERVEAVTRELVDHLYKRLGATVSTASPKGLIEFLVIAHERLLADESNDRLTLPTKITCFGGESELVRELAERIPSERGAAIALRFLIEFIVSSPPNGYRPISLSLFDELMAISSQIVNTGWVSELNHLGVSEVPISLLSSGRLGFER